MSKNTRAFYDMSQDSFAQFMQEGTKLSTELETTFPVMSKMLDELMELAMRVRTLRQYCLNSAVTVGGTMKVDAERVITILDGG